MVAQDSLQSQLRPGASAAAVCVVALMMATAIGCGGPERPETMPVAGKVTFDGQPPPAGGMLYFAAIEPADGYPRRSGMATFDASGDFEAQSWEPGDGLVPGSYRVHAECWKTPPAMGGSPGVSHLPEAYQSSTTSGWEIEVSPDGSTDELRFDVK